MKDIIFKTEDYVFSHRVAGVCIKNNRVLLQKLAGEEGYAFPGGLVSLGERADAALVREFAEETGAAVAVKSLRWVGELFFPWPSGKPCHQICFYYNVELLGENIPLMGKFCANESFEGEKLKIIFEWLPLEKVKDVDIYPTNAKTLLFKGGAGTEHFVYKE